MSTWNIKELSKAPPMKAPILVEGLPGIGNVGKVAVDFIIDEIRAKKIAEFTSYSLPNSVFVNEENLVEMPAITLYYKKVNNRDVLLLGGDIQPVDYVSCYTFSDLVLDIFQRYKGKEIVTLGGIALRSIPKAPRVFCTGNNKDAVQGYLKGTGVSNELYGLVGPINGVSGVLLGLAARRQISAVSLLAETYGHPLYLGVAGAREIIRVLDKKLKLNLDLDSLDKELEEVQKELGTRAVHGHAAVRKIATRMKGDTNYIG